MRLRGGVIIIGSLLWQDDRDPDKGDKIRLDWRQKHLETGSRMLVRLPIRYGRYSRDHVYTMVFFRACQADNLLGTGYVVPLKGTIDIDGLIRAAREMATAEGMAGRFVGRGATNPWASMGILVNETSVDPEMAALLRSRWAAEFAGDGGGKDVAEYAIAGEHPSISAEGKLEIPWPRAETPAQQSAIDGLNFLIASSTKPLYEIASVSRYPSPADIARSVQGDARRRYFHSNRANAITTFEDEAVITALRLTPVSSPPSGPGSNEPRGIS